MLTPLEQYQQDLANGLLEPNEQQQQVIMQLHNLYNKLIKPRKLLRRRKPIKGLYIWGSVGVGKTYLMDAFYHNLPFNEKMRMHFHRFMKMIQDKLSEMQGHKDPLKVIAKNLAKETKVLCFDEFFVNDIADAMILANLFQALFANGITLVATSNVEPDNLYRYGLQRDKFLPAIELIKQYTQVLHVQIDHDYRLRHLTDAGVYFHPNNPENREKIASLFAKVTHSKIRPDTTIEIEGRLIEIVKRSTNVLWMEFDKLCAIPRSQVDYLYIAKNFSTLFLTNVPVIEQDDRNRITYFINLIDILYDASVNLIILADAYFDAIYPRGALSFEYQRTKSRLQEMQSQEYLTREHLV